MAENPPGRAPSLSLGDFVPFRLNRLADAVSKDLAEIYRQRFDLEIPEWRVLVTAGQREDCTAQHIVSSTRMHKTRVSRAIASLEARDLIERTSSSEDGREMHLRLTRAGRKLYAALVPLVLERERELLSCLGDAQRESFIEALGLLEGYLQLGADE